jgi:hypothetical protein
MGTWKFKVQPPYGEGVSAYWVEQSANTVGDAHRIVERRERGKIVLCKDVKSGSSESSDNGGDGVDLQTVGIVLAVIFGFYIIATFWWIFGIIGAVVAGRWLWKKLTK